MRKLLLFILAIAALSGCGAGGEPAADATRPVAPATAAPATASPAPTASPVALPTLTPASQPDETQAVIEQAQRALANHLGTLPDNLSLASFQTRDWSDGSLGCPAPDRGYTQAIVPGYLLVFSDGSEQYSIHTSREGRPLILCQDGMPVVLGQPESGAGLQPIVTPPTQRRPDMTLPPTPDRAVTPFPTQPAGQQRPPEMQRMLELAITQLAATLNIDTSAVSVAVSEPAVWDDAALGCPQPGFAYPQVITEGYRFVLDVSGTQYEVHTDTDGSVVICADISSGPPPGSRSR